MDQAKALKNIASAAHWFQMLAILSLFILIVIVCLGTIFFFSTPQSFQSFLDKWGVYSILAAISGFINFFISKGLQKNKKIAWGFGLVIAFIMLVNIPVGTILGIIILTKLLSKEVRSYFKGDVSNTISSIPPSS